MISLLLLYGLPKSVYHIYKLLTQIYSPQTGSNLLPSVSLLPVFVENDTSLTALLLPSVSFLSVFGENDTSLTANPLSRVSFLYNFAENDTSLTASELPRVSFLYNFAENDTLHACSRLSRVSFHPDFVENDTPSPPPLPPRHLKPVIGDLADRDQKDRDQQIDHGGRHIGAHIVSAEADQPVLRK